MSKNDKDHEMGSYVFWALVFIWGGLVLLIEILNWADGSDWWSGWSVFFVGVGVLILIGTVIGIIRERKRKVPIFSLIIGSIVLGIGIDGLADWVLIWPIVLIMIGIIILSGVVAKRR